MRNGLDIFWGIWVVLSKGYAGTLIFQTRKPIGIDGHSWLLVLIELLSNSTIMCSDAYCCFECFIAID